MTDRFETEQPNQVRWYNCAQVVKKRRLLRDSVVTELQLNDSGTPEYTRVNTDDISKLNDPDLRYALRFAATTAEVGLRQEIPGIKTAHFVTVNATDEGLDSRFLRATYSGVVEKGQDSFLDNLRSVCEL